MILERVLSPFWLWHILPSCHPFTTVLVKFKFILISYFQANIFSLFICFIHRLLFQGLFVSGCVWSYLPWGFNGKTLTNISETRNQIRPFLFSYSFLFLLFFTLSHYMSVSNTLIILMLKWGTSVFLQISLPLSLFFFLNLQWIKLRIYSEKLSVSVSISSATDASNASTFFSPFHCA